jgi:hypothetical protein
MSVFVNGTEIKTEDVAKEVDAAFAKKGAHDVSKVSLKAKLEDWIASQPHNLPGGLKLGSFETSFGGRDTMPKARWKVFPTEDMFHQQLVYEADTHVEENAGKEVALARRLLAHDRTKSALNELRRAIGAHLWNNDSWGGWLSTYVQQYSPLNMFPHMAGSYNLANSYPKDTPFDYLSFYEGGTGPNGEPMNTAQATAAVFHNIAAVGLNWTVLWMANGLMSSKDRICLAYSTDDFTVAQNVAILHDIKELYSPQYNSRALPTWHKVQVPHPYQGTNSPAAAKRWATDGRSRVAVKAKTKGRDGHYQYVDPPKDPKAEKGEVKWDQGRLGAGTRDEGSDDTVTAETHNMPIETGRSHTAARLFEMVSLLKPDPKDLSASALFATRMQAMAYGIFAYWNAPSDEGGYPKSLTPIHTYHEVMDPLEDYHPGSYSKPFTYDNADEWLET